MNMKKLFALALTAVISVCAVFAQSFVVKSVKGTVKYESEPKVYKPVTVGQSLSATTVVNVGLNSELIIELNGNEYKIPSMKNDSLEKLLKVPSKGLSKGGSAAGSVGKDASAGNSVSTASNRAQDLKNDVDWADDEEEVK